MDKKHFIEMFIVNCKDVFPFPNIVHANYVC